VVQETRLYDPERDETRSMRTKEEANDYRYFPDPDLLPLALDAAFIEQAAADLPELPDAKRERFRAAYGLTEYDASLLTASRELADYFEAAAATAGDAKLAANWVNGELAAALNRDGREITESPVSAEMLAGLLVRIRDNTLHVTLAKQVFDELWGGVQRIAPLGIDSSTFGQQAVDSIIEGKGLRQLTDSGEIERIIDAIVAANPEQVAQYRAGKDKVFGFFVGQVMKASKGKANPQQVNELLKARLKP